MPAISHAQTNDPGRFRLMILDPGHFHAALVQKFMYPDVSPLVHIYAPAGDDLEEHLKRVVLYNTRTNKPTHWEQDVYRGPDYFEKMLANKPGNVVVLAGNNAHKTEYILRSIQAGLNVLADKPMVITPAEFPHLQEAFQAAASNHVLLSDIMTERYEITTVLQRELSQQPALFGEWLAGSPDAPAIVMESVHCFSKVVSGVPLKRPAWSFDTRQQGEGLMDVGTHLVDLVQWEAFPEEALTSGDVTVLKARRWTTPITRAQFQQVTGEAEFPAYLRPDVTNGVLGVYANGEVVYRIRHLWVKVTARWDFQPPPGGGDSHYSALRGTRATLVIRQGAVENYHPTLYIEEPAGATPNFVVRLQRAIEELQSKYPGIGLERAGDVWRVTIPESYNVGHEAHFSQVTENYLQSLRTGHLPAWEVPNMLTKYSTLMRAYALSR